MLLHPANFLLLDEPTNHLDMRAKDVLLESLQNYNGTVVFVSHDRYFIDKLATRIFEVGSGRVEVFPGNYEDYLWRKQRAGSGEEGADAQAGDYPTLSDVPGYVLKYDRSGNAKPAADSSNGNSSPARKRINPIKRKQMQDRHQQVEAAIAQLEKGVADCETALQSFVSAEETQRQTELLEQHRSELAQKMAEWEELSNLLQQA
jgi:ATP-binding cassette subfamily F protein 3